ncbi:phosphoethanolamine transferase [Bartonella sp. LJL80]
MRIYRPTMPSGLLCIIVAAYLLFVTNQSFWQRARIYFDDHPSKIIILGAILLLWYIAGITVFSVRYLLKPLLIFLVLVAAGAGYYTDTFGIIIDRHVIESTFSTTMTESSHLLTTRMITHIILYGLLPSLLIIWVKVSHRPFFKKLAYNTALIVVCLLVSIGLLFSDFSSFAAMYRAERSMMMEKLMPVAPLKSTIQYAADQFQEKNAVLQPLGRDAKSLLPADPSRKKRLLVIVVGETARAKSFSLDGYQRETNPELKKRDIIYFPHTTSCGTETSVSVPCMFSIYPRKSYSGYKGKNTENLMDVVAHAGIKAVWWENNTGSKGVADRIEEKAFQESNNPTYCTSKGECRDQILVDALKEKISAINQDTVLVLHTLGSHGPAYYLRYPADSAVFKPDCRTSEFSDCENAEIVNAYDNSIVYTDRILSEIIDTLSNQSNRLDTSMLYMSDHGESLGENGLYLHAMPYAIAPDEQTDIPFIAWFSQGFAKAGELSTQCVADNREKSYSHDNLFHTVLGLMDIKTSVYDKKLDVFAACRNQ